MLSLFIETGAAEESRTLDLYLGKVSLYQLSYCRIGARIIQRSGSVGQAFYFQIF